MEVLKRSGPGEDDDRPHVPSFQPACLNQKCLVSKDCAEGCRI